MLIFLQCSESVQSGRWSGRSLSKLEMSSCCSPTEFYNVMSLSSLRIILKELRTERTSGPQRCVRSWARFYQFRETQTLLSLPGRQRKTFCLTQVHLLTLKELFITIDFMLSQYGSHYMLCTVTEVRLLKGCKAVHQWWLASRAGSVSPNESKIPGSILGENTNAFGVVTGIRHKNLPIKYVMLRAVTTPCERSSNAKQLYSIQPSPITTVPTGDDSKTCRQWG